MRKRVLYILVLLVMGAFSVSNAQIASGSELDFGINEPQISVELYPNPAINYINVDLTVIPESARKPELQVYNVLGNKIKTEILNQGRLSYKITLDNLPRGYYFVSIKIPDTEIHKTYKFLKR